MGMALALIFYFVIRGGLLSTGVQPNETSPFGIAAVAGLVGMFSKQTTDKLRELFDNLFKTEKGKGDDIRGDKLLESNALKDVMVELNDIKAHRLKKDEDVSAVKIKELLKLLGGHVTRSPVFDDQNCTKHLIHQSLLNLRKWKLLSMS